MCCWPGAPAYLHGGLGIVVVIQEGWQSLHNGVGVCWRGPVDAACCRLWHWFGFAGWALRGRRVALAGGFISATCHTSTVFHSSPALSPFTPCPLPPLTHPGERGALTLLQTTTPTSSRDWCPQAPALPLSSFASLRLPLRHRGITHTPAQCSWSRAHRKESEADNETVPSSRSASCCHHPGFIPWQARLATLLVQGPTWMGALCSHGLAAGWLCLFSRLRLLRLLGLDQLRLSYSDKLESK